MKKLALISLILLMILCGCKRKEFAPFVIVKQEILELNRTYKAEDLIEDVDNAGLIIEVLSNNIDTSHPGDYTVTYKISSPNGKKHVEKTFIFRVRDNDAPVLTVSNEIHLKQGQLFNISDYAQAYDSREGNLTDRIVYSGEVNSYREGTYWIQVSVTDSFSNTSTEKVAIIIEKGDPSSFIAGIAGDYTDISYEYGQAPSLTINTNKTFTLYLNGCSILSAVEGEYVMYENHLYLRSPNYHFSDKPEEDLVCFVIMMDGTLKFETELNICAPNYGDIFKKSGQ